MRATSRDFCLTTYVYQSNVILPTTYSLKSIGRPPKYHISRSLCPQNDKTSQQQEHVAQTVESNSKVCYQIHASIIQWHCHTSVLTMLLNYRPAIVEKHVLVHACWVKTGKSLKVKRILISLIIPKCCAWMAFGVYFYKRRVGHHWTHVMSHFLAVGWNRCFSSSLVLRTKTSFMCSRIGSG